MNAHSGFGKEREINTFLIPDGPVDETMFRICEPNKWAKNNGIHKTIRVTAGKGSRYSNDPIMLKVNYYIDFMCYNSKFLAEILSNFSYMGHERWRP